MLKKIVKDSNIFILLHIFIIYMCIHARWGYCNLTLDGVMDSHINYNSKNYNTFIVLQTFIMHTCIHPRWRYCKMYLTILKKFHNNYNEKSEYLHFSTNFHQVYMHDEGIVICHIPRLIRLFLGSLSSPKFF